MKRLTEIGTRTGADKAYYHMFTEVYEEVFAQYESPRILEIGVHMGSSMEMYLEYFKNAYVVGMDLYQKVDPQGRWKFVLGDQTNVDDLQKCVEDEPYDIILDDGGHTMRQQQISFGFLFKHVRPGGYYILEDLHTSADPRAIEPGTEFTSYQMLERLRDGETYFSNYISKEDQLYIANNVESVLLWHRIPGVLSDSVTSIIKVK